VFADAGDYDIVQMLKVLTVSQRGAANPPVSTWRPGSSVKTPDRAAGMDARVKYWRGDGDASQHKRY
jgi:hypothetical protein